MYTHPAASALRSLGAFQNPTTAKPVLDSANDDNQASAEFAAADLRLAAAAIVNQWVETETADLDEGENMADRLTAMLVGIADENKDGEISDEEASLIEFAMNAAYDYMVGKGVTDEDAAALLDDGDNDAALRVAELLKDALPSDATESMSDIDNFAFDKEAQESVMDAVLDAVYKKRIVIRAGKKVRINKRVSGTVHLSSAQKVGIRKARLKSHSAAARMHRMKSVKLRSRMGLK